MEILVTSFPRESQGGKGKEKLDHNIAANTRLGRNKKSELSLRIQHIASKLRGAGDDVRDGLKIDSSSFVATSNQSQRTLKHTHLATSYIVERKVYGEGCRGGIHPKADGKH